MNRPLVLLAFLTTAALNFSGVVAAPPEMFNPNIVWRDQDINAPYEQYRDYRFSKGTDGRTSFTITWLSAQDGTLVAGPFPGGQTNPSEPTYFDDLGNGRIRIGSSEFQVAVDATGRLNFSRDGKATHRLSSHPPISRDVEIIVNSESPHDDYVTWAPTTCFARLTSSAGRTDPMTVVLTNDAGAEGGDVLFAANQNPWPRFTTATQEELTLTLPASGEWVSFVIAGKFGRSSLRDKDAIIDVHDGTADGRILGGHALMVRVRKAAETLTPEERYRFLRALAMMQRRGGGSADYEFYYRLHANTDVQNFNHGTSTFLPWHRALLIRFERELQANDPSVSLPYWNWQQPPGEIFNPEFLGTGGARVSFDGVTSALSPIFEDGLNPIHHFQIRRGEFPGNASLAPPRDRIEQELADALAKEDFEAFSHTLEDTLHNKLHMWVEGDMALFDSPKDPAFFLHHCGADRTWAQWQYDLNRFGTTRPDYVPFANSNQKKNDKGELITITPPPVDTELILSGPMPASQITGVWPKEASPARPLHMIDYLNANVAETNLGFCYDNVPFGVRLAGVRNASPPTVTQRDDSRHILVAVQADELPSWSDFANPALTEDERLQTGQRLIVVTDQQGIDQLRGIAADRTQPVRIRVMAIELVPSAAILETLLEILENREDDLEVKKAAAKALQIALFAIHSEHRVRIFNALRQYINDPSPELRGVALSILVPHHDAAAVEFVKDSLSGKIADSHLPTVTAIQLLAADDPRKHLNVIRPFLNVQNVQAGPAVQAGSAIPAVPAAVVRKGLTNSGFEELRGKEAGFVLVETMPGWKTTDTHFEIWGSGFKEVAAHEGTQFVELNAYIDGTLYQDSAGIQPGSVLEFTFAHRGRSGDDTMKLTITDLGADNSLEGGDDTVLFTNEYTTGKDAWAVYNSTTEQKIKALGNTVRFAYGAISTATGELGEGNFLDAADFGIGVVTAKPVNVVTVDDNSPEVLTAAIEAIGFDPASRPLIVRHLQDRGQPLNVRKAALRAVEEDRGQAVNLAKRVVADSNESPQLRVAAINTLGGICSSRVHELNLRSEQVAAGRTPLVIKDDVPAISADGRASVYDLLKQTACSVDSPDVAAEAFRVAHWLRINDPAVRQRPQPPAAQPPAAQPPVLVPNQLPPVGDNFNPVPPINPGNFLPEDPGNFNQGGNPRSSINRIFGNGRNPPPQGGRALRGDCNRPLFGTIP